MTEHWHATSALVGLPGMPGSRSIRLWGERKGWVRRREGRVSQWLESSLPAETQQALQDRRASAMNTSRDEAMRSYPATAGPAERSAGRGAFDTESSAHKPMTPRARATSPAPGGEAIADARLDILVALDRYLAAERPPRTDDAIIHFARAYNAGDTAVSAETRGIIGHIERTTLIRWRRRRRGPLGWSGLIPGKRGAPAGRGQIDQDGEVRDHILALLEDRPHSSPKFIREFVAARFESEPKRIPSIRTVQRWLKAWRKVPENARLLSQIEDPDKHRSRRMPAAGDMSAFIERLHQHWEADSSSCDVLCTDGPQSLIVNVEGFARLAKVLVTPRSRTEGILALYRRCLIEWNAVSDAWRTDNGADYISQWARRVFADMEVDHQICRPYDPNGKPFVERFIKTISHGLFQNLPGFKGHSIEEQQRLRARHKFADRLGMPEGDLFSVALSSDELQQLCDEWIAYVYEHAPHEGLDKRTPFEVAAAWRRPVKRPPAERALDVLLAKPAGGNGLRKIHPKGIELATGGVKVDKGWYLSDADEFVVLIGSGEDVEVREDPTDLGRIYVFDGKGEFLCVAVNPDRLGLDRAEIAARMKAKARAIDAGKRAEARELKRRIRPETAQAEIIDAAKRRHGGLARVQQRGPQHETPAIGEAARAADEGAAPGAPAPRKRAAGADNSAVKRRFFARVRRRLAS